VRGLTPARVHDISQTTVKQLIDPASYMELIKSSVSLYTTVGSALRVRYLGSLMRLDNAYEVVIDANLAPFTTAATAIG